MQPMSGTSMNVISKIKLVTMCLLLVSCASKTPNTSTNRVTSDLWTWDASKYYEEKIVGKVIVFASPDIGKESKVTFADLSYVSSKEYIAGTIDSNQANEITLLEGDYIFYVRTNSWQQKIVKVRGGETTYLKTNGKEIVAENGMPNDVAIQKRGSIHSKSDFANKIKAFASISYDLNVEGVNKPVDVLVVNSIAEPTFMFNGVVISPEKKNKSNYKLMLKFSKGDNELVVSAIGFDKVPLRKSFVIHIKTDKEIALEINAAKELARKIAEDERQKRIQLEKEAKAKKAEELRIAREGDGTPDDLSCKTYGLKPQTQGYSECRMRLDLSRKEGERLQAANAKAKDDARKAELERRYEETQRQKAIVANRESKCRMIQSAEYAKPALGGFFESMNRANSAYDNCMEGLPQINTTCSKDVFGNINCTSR